MIEPLGPEIRRELQRYGPQAGMGELVAAWPGAVGESIARNAWPARFGRDGTLFVATKDAVWAFELGQRADEIRGKLGKLAPRQLRFAPGKIPDSVSEQTTEESSRAQPEPSEAQRLAAAEVAATIEDEELRALVARAAAASLAKLPSDRSFW